MRQTLWLGGVLAAALAAPAFAAGNVEAAIDPVSATLRITGDTLDNDIEVTFGGDAGSFTVTGRNGTTVNLLAAVPFTGVKSFDIGMGDGADRVDLTGTRVRGSIRVRLDAGNDTLVMSGVVTSARGRVSVRCGDGADSVIVQGTSQLGAPFVVLGQEGNDTFTLRNSEFLSRVRLDSGLGDDSVLLDGATFQDGAKVRIDTKSGDDTLEFQDSAFHDDVDADLGKDGDHAIVEDSDFSQDIHINGGGGGDDDLSLRSGNDFNRNHPPNFGSFEG